MKRRPRWPRWLRHGVKIAWKHRHEIPNVAIFEAGDTGRVLMEEWFPDQATKQLRHVAIVKMDKHFPALDVWGNCLLVTNAIGAPNLIGPKHFMEVPE